MSRLFHSCDASRPRWRWAWLPVLAIVAVYVPVCVGLLASTVELILGIRGVPTDIFMLSQPRVGLALQPPLALPPPVGHPHPETVQALQHALPELRQAGIDIVPVSRLMQ